MQKGQGKPWPEIRICHVAGIQDGKLAGELDIFPYKPGSGFATGRADFGGIRASDQAAAMEATPDCLRRIMEHGAFLDHVGKIKIALFMILF